MQEPIFISDRWHQMQVRTRACESTREAEDRAMRLAYSIEKMIGTHRAANMLRAAAEALESNRTPDLSAL